MEGSEEDCSCDFSQIILYCVCRRLCSAARSLGATCFIQSSVEMSFFFSTFAALLVRIVILFLLIRYAVALFGGQTNNNTIFLVCAFRALPISFHLSEEQLPGRNRAISHKFSGWVRTRSI